MIIVLSLVGLLLISIPAIQTQLANRLTKNINQNFQTEMKVEGVVIGFDGTVNLTSFFIADHHSDTLFYAKKFKTDLYSFRQWVNGNLFFSTTEFENVFLKITQYEGEKNTSLFQFTEKLLAHAETQSEGSVFVSIDNLNVTDGRFLMIDKNSPYKPLQFDKIKLKANDFFVVNEGLEVSLKNLKFDSNDYGKVNLNKVEFYYNPCAIDIPSFRLSSGETYLDGNISVLLPNGNFHRFLDSATIDTNIKGFFSSQYLENFIDIPNNFQPLDIKLSGTGSPNDFNFSNLEINQEVMGLKATLDIKDAFSASPIKAFLDLEDFKFISSKLTKIIPVSYHDQIPIPFLNYQSFLGSGTFSFEENELITDFQLTNGDASIINRSLFNVETDEGKFKLNHFKGTLELNKLDLSPWYPKLGWLTSKLIMNGYSVDSDDFKINFDIDVDEILLHDRVINNLNLKGVLKNNELKADFILADEYIRATSVMAYSWGESKRKYQFDLNLDQFNLHLFDSELGGGKAIYSGDLNLFLVGDTFDDLQGNLLFKNIEFETQTQVNSFNDFILETLLHQQNRIIRTINSDIININLEGEFQLSELNSLFSNAIADAFPFMPKRKIEKIQELVYYISLQTAHLNALFPNLIIDKKAVLRGVLSNQDGVSKMKLNIPKITFKDLNAENIVIQLDNQNPLFNTFMSIGKIQSASYEISELNTLGVKIGDTLNFRTEFFGRNEKNDLYQLNFALAVDDSRSNILLKPCLHVAICNYCEASKNNTH